VIRIAITCLAATVLVIAGCGGGQNANVCDGVRAENSSGVFIAFQCDFSGFESWTAFDLGDDQDDGVTFVGHRRAYINQLPPHGSSTFPVGTIVIKTIAEDQETPGQIFAMAKRGGSYNVQGATGWEWFELLKTTDAPPVIRWRGITPPAGEKYAGIAGGACNTCHALGYRNDFVPSTELSLPQF
jgi:hypothetical protein